MVEEFMRQIIEYIVQVSIILGCIGIACVLINICIVYLLHILGLENR